MVDYNFNQSTYKFTDPIRYFKANDPYYWEVDNIPLKQLQENTLWLKDQITSGEVTNLDRSSFKELKPFVNEGDRIVHVYPGRYTARINDAFGLEPLNYLTLLQGSVLGELELWSDTTAQLGSALNNTLKSIVDTFKASVANTALNVNGLLERAFTYPLFNEDTKSAFVGGTADGPLVTGQDDPGPFPYSQVLTWARRNAADALSDGITLSVFDQLSSGAGFVSLNRLETSFIKRWRGVTRTSIVDVASELELTIPDFDENEFFYTDEDGATQLISGATQRIDLLFIYSKPIDTSAVHINKLTGANQPTKITAPTLGLVKGAGVGIDFQDPKATVNINQPTGSSDSAGDPQILAHPADQANTDNGFAALGIHGSFPSPDDLMNISPLLLNSLETTEYELVGQSVLPIAYVVVKKTSSTLVAADLIDIRPFFRTAELAYNERAGIAAAVPQLSFANPAVGQAQLDSQMASMKLYVDGKSTDGNGGGDGGNQTTPRVVGGGMIFGGSYFGVESVLIQIELQSGAATNFEDAWTLVKQKYNLPAALALPTYPDWDLGPHATALTSEIGLHPNDYVNLIWQRTWGTPYHSDVADFASFKSRTQVDDAVADVASTAAMHNSGRMQHLGNSNNQGHSMSTNVAYCAKTIKFALGDVTWMTDYDVDVQFWNCVPQTNAGTSHKSKEAGRPAGVWVEKRPTEFTIYTAWAAEDDIQEDSAVHKQFDINPATQRDGRFFSGFCVVNEDLTHHTWGSTSTAAAVQYKYEPRLGICTFPTVTFSITGYPTNYQGRYYNLNTTNPTITLH